MGYSVTQSPWGLEVLLLIMQIEEAGIHPDLPNPSYTVKKPRLRTWIFPS